MTQASTRIAAAIGVAALAAIALGAQAPGTSAPSSTDTVPVTIRVDAASSLGPLPQAWRFFGADEPNYATMPHGRKLLGELGSLSPGRVYFRAHNLLTTGDGTPSLKWGSTNAYTEDAQGRPVYDWTILDGIFDSYRAQGIRPYVEIGFMPEALSVRPTPYRHSWSPTAKYDEIFTGWAYPPRDYGKWRDLVEAWTRHVVERYGRAEVEQWYWETWNEPNIGYWRGTPEEFLRLHDHAIDGVRRALPTARVGGPDTAGHGGAFTRAFLNHALGGTNFATGAVGTPLDFVAFHAKGQPSFVDGHVRLGISAQLATIDAGFGMVASYPALRRTPIVIGESDPDGCAACQGPQLGYRNTSLYASYTAASYARILDLALKHDVVLEGALTWAFEFENQPWFAGFRALATNGVDLPVLSVFRMLAKMQGTRVAATSDGAVPLDALLTDGVRARPDVSAIASRDGSTISVLAWHYHDDDVEGPAAKVTIDVAGWPGGRATPRVRAFRVDAERSNAYTAWKKMGSPASPTPEQYAALERAGQLAEVEAPRAVTGTSGRIALHLSLPRQGVALIVLER
jgi:xylan 1,4-beta-xylosidase